MKVLNLSRSRKWKNSFTWAGKKGCHFQNKGSRQKVLTDLQSRNVHLQNDIQLIGTLVEKQILWIIEKWPK